MDEFREPHGLMEEVGVICCVKSRELLASKSTCVMAGWVLNYAIAASVKLAVARMQSAPKDIPDKIGANVTAANVTGANVTAANVTAANVTGDLDLPGGNSWETQSASQALVVVFITFVIFSLVLLAATLLSRYLEWETLIPQRLEVTLQSGIALIPAWQWMNVVSAVMAACVGGGSVSAAPPYFVASVVFAIAMFTAGVRMLLEYWGSIADERSLAFHAMDSLKVSLGLGMGFALNVFAYVVAGAELVKNLEAQIIYVCFLTPSVAFLQHKGRFVSDEMGVVSPRPHFSSAYAQIFLLKTVGFLLIASSFVVGFAWKGMLKIIFPVMHGGILWQFLTSLLITCVLTALVVFWAAAQNHHPDSILVELDLLCMVASGMNIGWTWADSALAILRHFQKKEEELGKTLGIGWIWLFTFWVVLCACITAAVIDWAIRQLEPRQGTEEQKLIHSTSEYIHR